MILPATSWAVNAYAVFTWSFSVSAQQHRSADFSISGSDPERPIVTTKLAVRSLARDPHGVITRWLLSARARRPRFRTLDRSLLKNAENDVFPDRFSAVILSVRAPVAQLDRASASGAEGCVFESRRVRHSFILALSKIRLKGFLYAESREQNLR